MAGEYLKIWFNDIKDAEEFFDGNQTHLAEFLLNVYRSYAELPTKFRCKLVEKYFKTYKKQIDFIKNSKTSGKNGGFQKHENQEVKKDTLVGSLEGLTEGKVEVPLLPKDKIVKDKIVKDKSNKENTFSDEKTVSRNVFADIWFSWFFEKNGNRFGQMKKTKDGLGEFEDMAKKDWVGIATIQKYCEQNFQNLTDNQKAKFEPIDTFKTILENYDRLPKFYQENTNPSFIASKISEIISMVKKAISEQPKSDTQTQNAKGKYEKNEEVFGQILQNILNDTPDDKQIGHQISIAE